MKTINSIFIFLLFITCNIKSENSKERKDSTNDLIKKSNVEIQEKNEIWYFYAVSQLSITGEIPISIDEINKKFLGHKIEFHGEHVNITGDCINKFYYTKKEKSTKYWYNKDNMNYIKRVLNEDKIDLPEEISVILIGSPDDKCTPPFDELIQIGDYIVIGYKDYLIYFNKKEEKKNIPFDFKKEYDKLSNLLLPVDYITINSLEGTNFSPIPDSFKYFFNLDYLNNYKAIKLPEIFTIKPIIISAYQEVGERDLYLYTLSQNYKVIDKLTLFSIEVETESGNNIGCTFNIDENFKLTITERFENNEVRIKNYIINNEGEIKEIQ